MNAADRFPKTRALIEARVHEYFAAALAEVKALANRPPALWFWET